MPQKREVATVLRTHIALILTIARGTYLRAFRDRSLIVVSCFCAFLVLAQIVTGRGGAGVDTAVVFGVFACVAPGVIISLFIGNYTVAAEIEDRTLAILFAKPVTRSQFLLGKFIGILSMGLAYLVLLALVFCAVMTARGQIGQALGPFLNGLAVWGTFLGLLTALSLLGSVIMPGVGGIIATLVICAVGFLGVVHLRLLAMLVAGTPAEYLMYLCYYMVPNGVFFDINFNHTAPLTGLHVIAYGGWYMVLYLLIADALFRRKELG
ncbi:MAG: ABC transporter permease subunit [Planctomycetota bacterium]